MDLAMKSAPTDDRSLVRQMLEGDERAFDRFFESYFPGLYRFALARMNYNEDGAEEVAQAALCKAIPKLKSWRGEAALFTWLCTFTRHEVSAWYRSRNRRPEGVDLVEDDPEIRAALESLGKGQDSSPEQALQSRELCRLVQVALDLLPAHYGNALEWKYLDGLSVKEIAGRLDLSPKAAESVLTRAREAFREAFRSMAMKTEVPS